MWAVAQPPKWVGNRDVSVNLACGMLREMDGKGNPSEWATALRFAQRGDYTA